MDQHVSKQQLISDNRLYYFFLPLAAVGLILVYFSDPAANSLFPKCPFHWLTGLHCPGCGSQRALHQLLHGNIFAAMGYNFLMVLFLPYVLAGLALDFYNKFREKPLRLRIFQSRYISLSIFFVIITFDILRNIPIYPFDLLAP